MVENENYNFWITKDQYGLIVGIMSIGAAISSIPSGIFRAKYGTRKTILFFMFPSIIGSMSILSAHSLIIVSHTVYC